jgi:hypothetical protein
VADARHCLETDAQLARAAFAALEWIEEAVSETTGWKGVNACRAVNEPRAQIGNLRLLLRRAVLRRAGRCWQRRC